MKTRPGNSSTTKLVVIAVFAFVVVALSLLGSRDAVLASAFGPSPSHTGAPGENNCTSCHISYPVNSGDGSIRIEGVPANYSPGQQIAVTVVLDHQDATNYGFQFTAIDNTGKEVGTFGLPAQNPPQMQIDSNIVGGNTRQYIEHTSDGLFTDGVFGSNRWTFNWTAPSESAGKVDFYVAGNGANGDRGTSGDYIYTTSTSILPSAGPLVSISGKVTSPTGLALRNIRLTLTDTNSIQRIAVTSSFGLYSFADIPSGTNYILSAQSKRYRFAAKSFSLSDNLSNIDFTGME